MDERMSPAPSDEIVAEVCQRLEQDFGQAGRIAARTLSAFIEDPPFGVDIDSVMDACTHLPTAVLYDEFRQPLPFGTGGRRGPVGIGPNRINKATLAETVQGHANYLKNHSGGPQQLTVVIANDVRVFHDISGTYAKCHVAREHLSEVTSRSLALLAARIYAANDVKAYILGPDAEYAFMTTPELSFAIRRLGADGGINISASHNPPDDNGIKIYDRYGGQYVPPDDQALADEMRSVRKVVVAPDHCSTSGMVMPVPPVVFEDYFGLYEQMFKAHCGNSKRSRPIVFTPLSGCGRRTVGRALERLGFDIAVPPGQDPDGTFANIPFRAPNPEVEEATRPSTEYADRIGSTLVLSSDPDGDRLGVDVRHADDQPWAHLTGNQIAAIIAFYLLLDPEGPQVPGLVLETLVTTKLIGAIAANRADTVLRDDLLVGFKYLADVLRRANEDGALNPELDGTPLAFAAEESHGVLATSEIRDKDALSGAIYLAFLHERLTARGSSLISYLDNIYEQVGRYLEVNRSIVLKGAAGRSDIEKLMSSLRSQPLEEIGGQPVEHTDDHWDEQRFGSFRSGTDRESRNVIQYSSAAFILTIRPSGTEPKLKFYLQYVPASFEQAAGTAVNNIKDVAANAYNVLLSRIGRRLSEAALLIPDIIDLHQKEVSDSEIVAWVKGALLSGLPTENVVAGLTERSQAMTPGADPLPALASAIAWQLGEWTQAKEDAALKAHVQSLLAAPGWRR